MSLPTKTDKCDDVEIVIPPCDQSSKDMGPDEVKVQEFGDGIVIHFKNGNPRKKMPRYLP